MITRIKQRLRQWFNKGLNKNFKQIFIQQFARKGTQQKNAAMPEALPEKLRLNAGIFVTTDALINLQRQGRKLDLSRRSPALASTVGSHISRFRGRGMDYQESRIYQAGDDIRSMDWRVTARAGKPHTKLYQEERERPIVLCVDFNPGMFFGSKTALKSVIAAKTAALLAWAAAQRGDRVGGLLFNGEHHELAPKTGKRGALNLIRQLVLFADPRRGLAATQHTVHLNDELQRLRRIARPGSLVFIISDFYAINDETSKHLQRLRQHCDMVAIQIVDPLEITAPPSGRYGVVDSMSGQPADKSPHAILDTRSKKGQDHYTAFFSQHHKTVSQLMHQHMIPLIQIATDDDCATSLQKAFNGTGRKSVKERAA